MPSYTESFTGRYKVRLRAAGIEHVLMIRAPRGTSLGSIVSNGQSVAHDIYAATVAKLADDFAWIAAEVADQDSTSFIPTSVPSIVVGTADWTSGDGWSARKRASGLTFSGRGLGTKGRVTLWGLDIDGDKATDIGANGIITPSEWAAVTTIKNVLQSSASMNSGVFGFWYDRATHKVNDKLLADIRKGSII